MPLAKPVVALLADADDGFMGECWDDHDCGQYMIRVDPLLDYAHAHDTLMHEWAHLSYYEDYPERFDLHDDGYWIRFGILYRAVFPEGT